MIALLAALAVAGPERSVFLPVGDDPGQAHPSGRASRRSALLGIPLWTQDDPTDEERLVETDPVDLAPGEWIAVIELWHRAPRGSDLVTVEIGGLPRAEWVPVRAERDGLRGQQTAVVPFRVDGDGPISVRLTAAAGHRVWIGAIRLAPAAPRPFLVGAHCANSPARARRALAAGATLVELDVRWRKGAVVVGHPDPNPPACWLASAVSRDVDRLVATLRDADATVLVDVKRPRVDTEAYAAALRDALAPLPPDRVVVSVPVDDAERFLDALDLPVHVDAWHDVADGDPAPDFVDRSLAAGSDFLGIGADPAAILRPPATWAPALADLVDRRERDGTPERVYFWTLQTVSSMRLGLDAGVDAILANTPRRLARLVATEPYASLTLE